MEVLQCSDAHYVGESDCPQQGSGARSFRYDGESNCIEHKEQVLVADVKMDDVVLRAKGTREEGQGGGQCVLDEFTTSDSHYAGNSYCEFEVDGQKPSPDSHDSEGDDSHVQDHFTGPGLPPENFGVVVDTIESGLSSSIREGESSNFELKCLEQDEPMAVWVKWRGKWQAGIRCARADWPLSTLKAKPTHDRKNYLVIFFPRTRNYSWADVLLVRPINEFPQPIAYRTHKVGMKMVKDLTLARRFILQKLAVSMINVLDLLHIEAMKEIARDVIVWKEFAIEASRCKSYCDLGRMLTKLQNMILQCYLSPHWMQNGLPTWVQRCQNAVSAEAVQMLKEELLNSILWDEVNLLLHAAAQPDLISEWKTLKHEVMKSFSMSNPISGTRDPEQLSNDNSLTMEIQNSRKRPKLEVRRAESHVSQVVRHDSHEPVAVEIDSLVCGGLDVNASTLELCPSRNEISLEDAKSPNSCGRVADTWDDIVVQAGNSEVIQNKDVKVTLENRVSGRKSLDPGNKNRQCMAFIEAKGRQCVRQANDGDVYCCVHLASRFVNSGKAEVSPSVEAPMCEGTTVLGTKCKHRSLQGSSFCKKHKPKDSTGMTISSIDDKHKIKHKDKIIRSETTNCKETVLVGEVEAPLHIDPFPFVCEATNITSSTKMPDRSGQGADTTEVPQCIGPCIQDGNEPCSENPTKHSLYCEKHVPSWLKRARNGKSRIISKEVFLDLLRYCCSREQKLHLHQACELFYKLFKSILSLRNPIPKEVQFQWAISEALKDVRVGEFLMKLVCSEKERLKQIWGFTADNDTQASSVEHPVPILMADDSNNENIVKCKICLEKFLDDQSLGTHFMDVHKKEAQWLFRGYVCAICLDSFTNKKVLETHVQERHHVQFVEQCMLFQCIPCGSHFGNPEQLWPHVLAVHSSNFRLQNTAQQNNLRVDECSSQKPEPHNLTMAENVNPEIQGSIRKFICRFCGLKFDLLPDLGRHHQAAHMGPNSTGARIPKRGIRYYAYRLKSGKLTRPKFKRGTGARSFKIRNRGATSMKKCIEASNLVSNNETRLQPNVVEASGLGRMAESQCSAVAKLLHSEIKKTKPRPGNMEILSIARSSCCKVSLQASLAEKYGLLPERIYLKAAKLCSEHNIIVEWHQQGYVCPKGCEPNANLHITYPLIPISDETMRSKSVLSSDPGMNEWALDECHCIVDSRHFRPDLMEKSIILCDDISFGQESVPIACVVDENLLASLHMLADGSDGQIAVYPWEGFTYITRPMIDQSICIEAESLQLGCACSHSTCSSEACDHVYLFDNDYEDAKDIYGKPMHGRFPYDERGRVILEEGYLVYECNNRCSCSKACRNRVLQNGVGVKLEVFRTENKGWAVRAGEAILRGTFVCEYIGEVIDEQEANNRHTRYGVEGCTYFYEIDAHINDMSRLIEEQATYVIDSTIYGNVSRNINHSCSPNLVNHQVLVESMDCQLAHIGLFARRDIAVGEELTYDYRYKLLPGEGCACLCGASSCRGRLH